jgi:branched-chain amino acid transport system permease protein
MLLRRASDHRTPSSWWLLWTVAVTGLIMGGALYTNPAIDLIGIAVSAAILGILAVSYQVVFGFAGQFSVAQAVPYGVGAYTTAILMTQWGYSFWAVLPIAMLAGALGGAVLGAPAWRLDRDYVALVTLAAGVAFQQVALNWGTVTGGSRGIANIPLVTWSGDPLDDRGYLVIAILLTSVVTIIAQTLKHSALGKGWLAIRDDELAARAMGVRNRSAKIAAFAVGGFLAGAAGALFAVYQSFVSSVSFGVVQSVQILLIVLLAGLGRIYTTLVVAIVYTFVTTRLAESADVSLAIIGAAILIVTILRYSDWSLLRSRSFSSFMSRFPWPRTIVDDSEGTAEAKALTGERK